MTYRIAWLSPFTGTSGVGTFSHAVTRAFPESYHGEAIDLTILHPPHASIFRSPHRRIAIEDTANFHQIMPLFDLLIYNIGNNAEHHEPIFKLLSKYPGIIICHDYVFQHYLVHRSLQRSSNFSSYGALLTKYGDAEIPSYLRRSRITSRSGGIRYCPWDSEYSAAQPLSEILLDLGSGLVLHSEFAHRHAAKSFAGPMLRLGMPYDQKRVADHEDIAQWGQAVPSKRVFHLVSFGHIQSTKCTGLIPRAIAASDVLRKQLRFTIAGFVGDPAYFRELQEIVASTSIQDVVTFETDISESRLDALMHEADIFANLRRPNTEGSSASLIEQLESGKPVIVLDSGSYAEIPANAAVKLKSDAGPADIQRAFENLLAEPKKMAAIGRAGQNHARSWSCKSYGEAVLKFAFENRGLLNSRARSGSAVANPVLGLPAAAPASDDQKWRESLARARRSLRYLDKNMLALDPEIILPMQSEAICTYAAQVIFGIFDRPELEHALKDYFARRSGPQRYFGCVTLMLIADTVFDGNASTRQRLAALNANFDLDLWAVIEHLPPATFLAAANLLLPGSQPVQLEQTNSHDDRQDGRRLRLLILNLLETIPDPASPGIGRLRRWLEEPPTAAFVRRLPLLRENLSVEIGSNGFRENAALWGFHKMESDHAWMQGAHSFIGLRLGRNVTKIALRVRHVDANLSMPCMITLSDGNLQAEIEVEDIDPHWITLRIAPESWDENVICWLRITTSHISPPPNSEDTRILGCCVLQLEVTVKPARHRSDLQRILLNSDS